MGETNEIQGNSRRVWMVIAAAVIVIAAIVALLFTLLNDDSEPAETETTRVNALIHDTIGDDSGTEITANLVTVTFPLNQVSVEVAREDGERDALKALCTLREEGYTETRRVTVIGTLTRENNQGQTTTVDGMTVELVPATIAALDCDNQDSVDLQAAADSFSLHPDLQE